MCALFFAIFFCSILLSILFFLFFCFVLFCWVIHVPFISLRAVIECTFIFFHFSHHFNDYCCWRSCVWWFESITIYSKTQISLHHRWLMFRSHALEFSYDQQTLQNNLEISEAKKALDRTVKTATRHNAHVVQWDTYTNTLSWKLYREQSSPNIVNSLSTTRYTLSHSKDCSSYFFDCELTLCSHCVEPTHRICSCFAHCFLCIRDRRGRGRRRFVG